MSERPRRRHLGVIEGGRAELERHALRAVVFDLPDATELVRRLAACANNSPMRLIDVDLHEEPAPKEGGQAEVPNHE